MPVRTPHFGLEAFITGDVYSASVDRRRFTAIDSHMAFISELVGPGVIQGWELSVPSPFTLSVSSGWGMIGRYIARTFGDYSKSLLDNSTVYAWMRLRPGVIGQISAFSDLEYVSYSDTTAPSAPTGLSVSTKSTDSVTFTWTQSSDIDFGRYEVYKSADNITYALLAETTDATYTDVELEENTVYYYKIKAYDLSENASPLSSSLIVVTDKDLSIPADPGSVRIANTKNAVHLIWNPAPYGNIATYRAYVTPVNEERIATGSTFTVEVDSLSVDMTIGDLTNEQRYLVVLKSVSVRDVESEGVTRLAFPVDTGGPPDVLQITVIDYEVTSGNSTNGITLSWASDIDPYSAFDGSSEILLEEYRNDGTVITSNWIPTLAGYTTRSIEVFPYVRGGQTYYKSLESRTTYYITVRNIDANGIRSVGKRIRHYTRSFASPDSPQSLSVTDRTDKTLIFRWENSPSTFLYNRISVVRTSLSDLSETTLVSTLNVGRSTIFSLEPSYSLPNNRYTFSVGCVDEFGNESESRSISYDTGEVGGLTRPPPPLQQIGFAGDKQNTITWNAAATESVKAYRIYRSLDSATLDTDGFELLETVSATTFSYTDYEVENGTSYVYFVTTVDLYDQESLNPRDDRYINYTLTTLKPVPTSTLNSPGSLEVSPSGSNVQITWTPTGGQFDGYEVYRSIGNKYSFRLIATVAPSITYYVDYSVLRQTGNVYYMVRKFRNEADLFVTESNISITSAIFLGKVTTRNGSTTIDLTGVRNISLLEDPVREETVARIAVHKHEWVDENNDRRINLNDNLVVSDWTSTDYQTYTTETDISETTVYSVFLNGEDASSFGLLYALDKDSGELTFESQIAATGFEIEDDLTFIFESPPTVTVEFSNLEETQNILPRNRFEGASAQQVAVGVFEKVQIPAVNHDGRIKEKLEPIQISTISVDSGYRYAPEDGEETIGDAVVFYDIIQTAGDLDILVAATSDGIYTSEDFGVSWDRRFETITPVTKFFYSSRYETYFAGSNRGALFGRGGDAGGFSIWTEIAGVENAKIIRDIVQDEDGNVFCSTDLGVYKLRRNIGQGSFFFQQTPIFGPRSTESYAMLFDDLRQRLIVSNELGIFESYNNGTLWTFSSEFAEQRSIHAFAQKDGYIYAITDFMLWRRKPSEYVFERIGVMENAAMARKLVIWNDRIYISTDSGLLATSSLSDIYTDRTVTFEQAFAQLRVNSSILPATSLGVIDNKLFVGSEERLFISDRPGKLSLHSEFKHNIIPTVYVNGEAQTIGYRFTTNTDRLRKFVCFDVKQRLGAVVTIANQYKKFKAKNGGWADTNYLSAVSLFIDGVKLNSMSLSERPAQEIGSIVLPEYNDRNAHKAGADTAAEKFEAARNSLLEVERNTDGQITKLKGFTKDRVTSTLYAIERFLSQLYPTARIIETTDDQGVTTTTAFEVPEFRVLLLTPSTNTTATKISDFGSYKTWSDDADNSQSSVIGHFGSELTSDGILPNELIGGLGDLGSQGGGTDEDESSSNGSSDSGGSDESPGTSDDSGFNNSDGLFGGLNGFGPGG